jgi:MtrB/PioB family decaheme-associated outer membrane protein
MRIQRTTVAALLALGPVAAAAQPAQPAGSPAASAVQPPAQPAVTAQPAGPEGGGAGWAGLIDLGVRATDVDGDAARFERYRDMGDGLALERVRLDRATNNGWLLDFSGDHVGRRDQRFRAAAADPGRFRATFVWDQIPMLLSRSTRTLFADIGSGTLSIDDALQAQVQAAPSAIASVFAQSALPFETRTRRYVGEGIVQYFPSEAVTLHTRVRRIDRQGTIPFGGSFGHSSLVELPAPTEHTISDLDAGAEYARDPFLFRAGYTGSWFHNDVTSVVFDNPFRATDVAATPSRGRLTLPPSSSQIGVNGMASVKLPYRSRVTAYASIGVLEDAGDPIIPQTINSVTTAAPIERATVDGEARLSSINLRFTSRPRRDTDLTVSYRTFDYDNRTPEFAMTQRIAFDNTPSAVSPAVHTEPYSVTRGTFDADFRFIAGGWTSAGIGYTRNGDDRTHRIYETTTDHVLRLTLDAVSQRWYSVRTKYEHAQKRGTGIEQGEALLASIGEQPQLRHFDVASRDRDRVTIVGSITPASSLVTSLTFAAGKDDYVESVFGLRDNTHRVYGIGADYLASERASAGLTYSYERYDALQRSRQANPGAQFTDPSRNWAADSTDRTHSVTLNAAVTGIANKVDVRLAYDFTRARARYDYITGPVPDRTLPEEVPVPTSLPTPVELPPTLSQFNRGTLDVLYALTPRLSVGASYWYDRYRVSDFTLDVDANPELARGQALLMGYLYRPYTANTGWLRLLYRW